ncbi:MAG TPA: carboxypeptidase-like regulatory domain-containing protein, partial [Terriglobia bacterium]|nr:carboxypeptidase-like regulatory domain-containing protein [Terriglobia bacterium]
MSVVGMALLALILQSLPVQGVVLHKGTAEVLSKATVELHRDQGAAGILDSVTTEDDGRFSFSNVEPGHYWLIVMRRGYARPPLAITITAGRKVEDIQLNMTPAGSISGNVFDSEGHPVANVEVQAMKASYPEGRRKLAALQSVRTNDLGEYRLFGLSPGRYYVAAVHPKVQAMSQRMVNAFGMSMGGPTGMIISKGSADPALGEFGFAQVPDSESARYAPIFYGGTTDEQSASAIELREGAEFNGVNFVVGPVQPRHVRGVVIDGLTGRAAQYGSITMLRGPDAPRMKDVEVDNETGRFDMVLFPGSHALTANSASGEGYAVFTLGDADIDNLTIPTTPEIDITGRIVVEGPPINASALEDLQLSLRRDPPRGEQLSLSYSSPL